MKGKDVQKLVKEALKGLDRRLVKAVQRQVLHEDFDLRQAIDLWQNVDRDQALILINTLTNVIAWEKHKAIYAFDKEVVEACRPRDEMAFTEEDFRLLPFKSVFLNAEVGENPAAVGAFFSLYPLDGAPRAVFTVQMETGKVARASFKLGFTVAEYAASQSTEDREQFANFIIPYLTLAKFLASRNAEMTRDVTASPHKGFGKTPKGRVEAWAVSYRKAADFAPRPDVPLQGGQPLSERPAAPRLKTAKKTSIRAHRQRYWRICQDDPRYLIREWTDKKEKRINEDAPGDLPITERDVPL